MDTLAGLGTYFSGFILVDFQCKLLCAPKDEIQMNSPRSVFSSQNMYPQDSEWLMPLTTFCLPYMGYFQLI